MRRRWACLCTALIVTCFAALMVSLSGGCSMLTPGDSYVKADRATFEPVKVYLSEHAAEHPQQAPVINDLVFGWQKRLEAAERSLNPTQTPATPRAPPSTAASG